MSALAGFGRNALADAKQLGPQLGDLSKGIAGHGFGSAEAGKAAVNLARNRAVRVGAGTVAGVGAIGATRAAFGNNN